MHLVMKRRTYFLILRVSLKGSKLITWREYWMVVVSQQILEFFFLLKGASLLFQMESSKCMIWCKKWLLKLSDKNPSKNWENVVGYGVLGMSIKFWQKIWRLLNFFLFLFLFRYLVYEVWKYSHMTMDLCYLSCMLYFFLAVISREPKRLKGYSLTPLKKKEMKLSSKAFARMYIYS